MRTAAFSVRGLPILMDLTHDHGGGFWEMTYPSSGPWVDNMVDGFPLRTAPTLFVVGGRAVSKTEPPARVGCP